MLTFNYKKWDIITGWACFAIALICYTLTVEPTVSFWDPGEYIATSAKLQVGHPPGAPFYQMLGAFFSLFALENNQIALMVNMVAVFSSAFTILFMFWSVSNLLKKIAVHSKNWKNSSAIAVLGSAAIGSLAFTFSDSFWFSAVEAEVYASAMMFISLLLYLGLKWVDNLDQPTGDKWLLLIALVTGCSFGVHLMALLTIPSIVLLFFFKRYQDMNLKKFITANLVAVAILFFLFAFLFPKTLALFGKTEIFMVNSMGMPFNSGTIFIFILIVALFVLGLKITKKHNHKTLNTLLLALLFVCIGMTSWIMLPIRANANVVINENRPSDAAELLAYYQREQYGDESIFFDSYFTKKYVGLDEQDPYKDDKPNYERDDATGKYVVVNEWKNAGQNYNSTHKGFMPRLWSTDRNHRVNYMRYTKPLNFEVNKNYLHATQIVDLSREVKKAFAAGEINIDGLDKFLDQYGQYLDIEVPSFKDNMTFMVDFQFGYMFGRYLMWNFVGRQNDIQGEGDLLKGNWISGIKFLDEIRLGSQDNLPSDMLNNKGRNTYFFIPFLLGLIGVVFHYRKDPKVFWALLVLFLFTSLALKVFLNERPFEPRERDYAVVPAFYVFSIWISFGVYCIYEALQKYLSPKVGLPLVLGACLLGAPVLMAQQNWDDHDRSNRYTALANAKAYLDSCAPNAILFTIGDNDTFPLWYLQDVEGYRTDVRVVCTSLLPLDWYIDQMKAKAYDSEPLPISFTHDQYVGNKRDAILVNPLTKEPLDINLFLEFIKSEDPRIKKTTEAGTTLYLAPADQITIPVNKETISKNNIVSPYLMDQVLDTLTVKITDQAIYKHRLIMLDIIAKNEWKRPIYFSGGSFQDEDFVWMKDYLQLTGLTYQLVPIKNKVKGNSPVDLGTLDADKMYDIVKKWYWGNMGSDNIYHDPQTRRNGLNYRLNLTRLMDQLIEENKLDKAYDVIEIAMTNMPIRYYGLYYYAQPFIQGYYQVGQTEKARSLAQELIVKQQEQLNYFSHLEQEDQIYYADKIVEEIEIYRELLYIVSTYDEQQYYEDLKNNFNEMNMHFSIFARPSL